MLSCDTLIRNATVLDGTGREPEVLDVAVEDGYIREMGKELGLTAKSEIDATGLALAPGFVDVHTHDDTSVIETPVMLPKLSQGVTTVIVGNCGISAAPFRLTGDLPDPMNLLGRREFFRYASFRAYTKAIAAARPAVNVAALAGHTAIRSNHLDRLDRAASSTEMEAMREDLLEALDAGAIGLSSGLAYRSAIAATTEEVSALAALLRSRGGVYVTHMRTETEKILDAMQEAFSIARAGEAPVVISHLKCAGVDNWGRSAEVLRVLDSARERQPAGCDCYPYAAGSSTLDLKQVDPRVKITITWSTHYPEAAGKPLADIAAEWGLPQLEAARKLQPAGAIYHSIHEEDMQRILAHPGTMIGSDGLPWDAHPHPRLWGTFPRVLGHYSRERKLFPLPLAVHKMTGLPAARFGLKARGTIQSGHWADLVLFDPDRIADRATYDDPMRACEGIAAVWVNGVLSYTPNGPTGQRAGKFLPRTGGPVSH